MAYTQTVGFWNHKYNELIIIFADRDDRHALQVSKYLKDEYHEKLIIVDYALLQQDAFIEASYGKSSPQFNLIPKNEPQVNLNEIKSVWWRRPYPIVIEPNLKDRAGREFAVNEWNTALSGIWHSMDCLWVNDILADERATHKTLQLAIARQIGLSTPETLITNSPSSALSFWENHQGNLIFKAFSGSDIGWGETRPLKRDFLQYINSVRFAPVIFQEYIDPATDVRITIIGNDVFTAEAKVDINNYQFDFRMSNVSWKEHHLPDSISDLLLKYMRKLGLEYGAIDMRIKSDDYWFLEINPAGQYLFGELDAGLPISESMAKHLSRGEKTT